MPVDRRKWMQAAERLLKQGKLQAALAELQRASESAPDDLLTLNRLGDLLARQGRNGEAIEYYRKIANQFADGGFLPKSVAIHKKILRIDPNNLESLVGLGELYLSQDLHGEARNYLLHAANQHLELQSFVPAREIYEKLVEAEPDEIRHRVRLAETRALEGDGEAAGTELLQLGRTLIDQGSTTEAERIFQRASELVPESCEPLLGLANCLVADGREDEALTRLEEAAAGDAAPAPVLGEIAWHYAQNGRSDEAMALLVKTDVLAIGPATWTKLIGFHVERGSADKLWSDLDPVLEQCEQSRAVGLAELLQQLEGVEERGHLPALERLFRLQVRRSDEQGTVRALESMVVAYQARSMDAEAKRAMQKLEELAPAARTSATEIPVETVAGQQIPVAAPAPAALAAPPPARPPSSDLPLEAEAPAVPLNRSDEEFLAGRLTQADVLEKYGLQPQALEQVESVTARFPGHVQAQEKRVALLQATAATSRAADALAALALARRAAGDNAGAAEAARQAAAGELAPQSLRLLQQCRLIEDAADSEAAESAATAPATAMAIDEAEIPETVGAEEFSLPGFEPTAAQPDAAADPAEIASAEPPEAVEHGDRGVDLVIDFDAEPTFDAPPPKVPEIPVVPEAAEAPQVSAPAAAQSVESGAPSRVPGADMLEEIKGYLDSGALDEAQKRIEALHTLGYAGEALDAFSARIETDAPSAVPLVESHEEEDLDLGAIEAVLEQELLQDAGSVLPEEDPEQSLDEVFSTFKAAVKEQVSDEDHGTHYDLAIAYKEMGLVDEAIAEFELAGKDPGFQRRAYTMIGLCYWERQELEPAADWYRRAIEKAGEDGEETSHLRYDLGELLLQSGDLAGALHEFQGVIAIDPTYREVRTRVSELEQQLQG